MFKFIILLSLFGCFLITTKSHKQKSDEFLIKNDYNNAILELEKHIEERIKVKREDWDNPYIYYLDIGDIYLKQNKIEDAIKYYELALKNNVKNEYIADKMRSVATYYEEKNQLDLAIEHLKKYRELDPEFSDMMLDRLARKYLYLNK